MPLASIPRPAWTGRGLLGRGDAAGGDAVPVPSPPPPQEAGGDPGRSVAPPRETDSRRSRPGGGPRGSVQRPARLAAAAGVLEEDKRGLGRGRAAAALSRSGPAPRGSGGAWSAEGGGVPPRLNSRTARTSSTNAPARFAYRGRRSGRRAAASAPSTQWRYQRANPTGVPDSPTGRNAPSPGGRPPTYGHAPGLSGRSSSSNRSPRD